MTALHDTDDGAAIIQEISNDGDGICSVGENGKERVEMKGGHEYPKVSGREEHASNAGAKERSRRNEKKRAIKLTCCRLLAVIICQISLRN